jgi:hypothetical protein
MYSHRNLFFIFHLIFGIGENFYRNEREFFERLKNIYIFYNIIFSVKEATIIVIKINLN